MRWIQTLALLTALPSMALATPPGPRLEKPWMPPWLQLDAEYRLRTLSINPIELGGEAVRGVDWSEQRLRLDLGAKVPKRGGVFVQLDVLDGVLLGDNGSTGEAIEPNAGIGLASRQPNVTGWQVGLRPGADPFQHESYIPLLREVEPVRVNWAFGRIHLPIGMLQFGRQPFTLGAGIGAHDGQRRNRWGTSHYSHTADRVLFGTKLDEIVNRIVEGPSHQPDTSQDNGVFLVAAWDWSVQDEITATSDDLSQVMSGLIWRRREADWGGAAWRDLSAAVMVLYKFNDEFGSDVLAVPVRLSGRVGPVHADLEAVVLTGSTLEIAEGYAALKGTEPVEQELLAVGGHASVAVDVGPVELMLQFDYASGDDDPRVTTPWTGFTYARDFNIGLLMFEHILAFESARSAAVGLQNMVGSGARSFPVTEVATDGRFTNAVAVFPQITWHALRGPEHWLRLRAGALFAWPAAAGGVIDPVATSLAHDGATIDDDRINYHGGRPGDYYGTEIDLQIAWTWLGLFHWTVEGAALLPGSGLQNAHKKAVPSFLIENRLEVTF